MYKKIILRFVVFCIISTIFNSCSSTLDTKDKNEVLTYLKSHTFQNVEPSQGKSRFIQFNEKLVRITVFSGENRLHSTTLQYHLGELSGNDRIIIVEDLQQEWVLTTTGFIDVHDQGVTLAYSPLEGMKNELENFEDENPANSVTNAETDSQISESPKDSVKFPNLEITSITEQEKGNFKFIEIGGLIWSTENLNVEHYRNGDPIPQVQDKSEWINLTTGAWCYFENNSENGKVMGKLYNWYAVNDKRGLAPLGWHIPDENDWSVLIGNKDNSVVGLHLKAIEGWEWHNGDNTTGFTAYACGVRSSEGVFVGKGKKTAFWSTREGDKYHMNEAFDWSMDYENDGFGTSFGSEKTRGLSIRCVRNLTNLTHVNFPEIACTNSIQQEKGEIKSRKIGGNVWATENLNVEHYRNGDPIPQVQDSKVWKTLKTGAWCYYESNNKYGTYLGKLYNWYAVNDPRGLAPIGWQIPENQDWHNLKDALRNESINEDEWSGKKLKSYKSWDWKNGTDEVGFNGLAGGYRESNGSYSLLHQYVGFWSIGSDVFYLKTTDNNFDFEMSQLKECGMYVRCIKTQ